MLNNSIEIKVEASGINFRNVIIAIEQIKVETLGSECSGIVTAVGNTTEGIKIGDRVSYYQLRTFSSLVRTKSSAVQKIPDDISFEVSAAFVSNILHYILFSLLYS